MPRPLDIDKEPKNSQVVHPAHYNNHPLGIECKDVIKSEPYYIASAVKYIVRRHDKGEYRLNLEKAIQCLRFQIADPFCDMVRYSYANHPSGIDIDSYIEPMNEIAKAALEVIFKRHDDFYKTRLQFAIGLVQALAKKEKGITL